VALLQVSELDKAFGGVAAIANLSFDVPEGQIYSVIGPNGAGKTTLFNMLSGVYVPSAGTITFDGRGLNGLAPDRVAATGISRTFQNLQIFFNMTVLENVMIGCHLRSTTGLYRAALRLPGVAREERRVREWALEALAICGLDHLAARPADALPYGELKRVEIARALAAKPRLLLMDEPAAGLNDTETVELRGLIAGIRDEVGITVLLVEHNMGLVMPISDTVLVLDYGSKLAEGTAAEIQNDPRVIAAYLGGEVQDAV